MSLFIALLRGINVSGCNKIKMVDLKELFLNLGYTEVTTYIQSGNVLFKNNTTSTEIIEKEIVKAINIKYGYTINVLVITKTELGNIFNNNPFLNEVTDIDTTKLHVTLLNKTPDLSNLEVINNLISTTNDRFKILNKTIYLYCPNGYGKTKLNNNLFEKKLNTSATTRNWKTITKLTELSN